MNMPAAIFSTSASIGSAVANHLWQSTVFAAVAALLTLLLRKNHARTRYGLWLAGSLKFLLPFALLVSVGTRLQWWKQAPAPQSQVSIVMDQITQPFAAAGVQHAAVILAPAVPGLAMCVLPLAALTLWFLGFAALLIFWCVRWRRVASTIRQAERLESGREVELLRRVEQSFGLPRATRLLSGSTALEPGIVGIFSPVMFLPARIAERLNDSQLSAVMMHELCHLRRRDNLAAVLHMLVESVFWFHPLVWWMGARLIDERERACDEEVLALGSEPQAYAEGILKVCEFYLESPLACVAGVTGSNLKKRIEAIMIHRIARKLEFGKKLLLATLGAAALIAPVFFGLFQPAESLAQSTQATGPTQASQGLQISIEPKGPATGIVRSRIQILAMDGHAELSNQSLHDLLKFAYHLDDSQIAGEPAWLTSELYDVSARFPKQSGTQFSLKLQKALADKFHLATHRELRRVPVYELSVGPNGVKMTEVQFTKGLRRTTINNPSGHFEVNAGDAAEITRLFQQQTDRPVIDKTGLKGHYNFTLVVNDWTQPAKTPEDAAPFLRAVSEQLGLELKPASDLLEVLVIDHAEPVTSEKKRFAATR